MKTTSQVTVYVATLLGTLFLGTLFSLAFWQMRFHAERLLGSKPLPVLSEFFIENNGLPFYLLVLPWLWLVGAPWLTRAASGNYWDASAFVLRSLAFFACEVLLLLLLTTFLFLPFVPYYSVMSAGTPLPGQIAGWLFWIVVAGTVCLGGWKTYQSRRPSA